MSHQSFSLLCQLVMATMTDDEHRQTLAEEGRAAPVQPHQPNGGGEHLALAVTIYF